MNLSAAVAIVKTGIDDPSITGWDKLEAIIQVSKMETQNSITKGELSKALKWICDHVVIEDAEKTENEDKP